MTKLETKYTEIGLQILKFTIILDSLILFSFIQYKANYCDDVRVLFDYSKNVITEKILELLFKLVTSVNYS